MQATATNAPTPQVIRIDPGPNNVAQSIALPQSVQEIAGLRQRRSELADQLERAWNRRDGITEGIAEASGVEREGLEARLSAIDGRVVQIEADIAATERALTNAAPGLLATAAQADEAAERARDAAKPAIDEEIIGVLAIMSMLMLVPFVIAYTRRIWRRPVAARSLPGATENRLERIEQAVEAIAVEVERVSEGQRFVTKLMSEGKSDRARMLPEQRQQQ